MKTYLKLGFVMAALCVCIETTATKPVDAAAQAHIAAAHTPAKPYSFEVASIRQNISEVHGDMGGPTPDGYRMTNSDFALLIDTAYIPQTGTSAFYSPAHIKGLPDWANAERYDIDARIPEVDRAAWQNPPQQTVMLRSMLQGMLAERCKLAVHRETKDSTVYLLMVGKDGIKFKETNPAVPLPLGMKLPWGGVMVHSMDGRGSTEDFHGTSIAYLASYLSNILSGMGHHEGTVQDKTGLTGRYDFVIKFPPIDRGAPGASSPDDPSQMAFTAAKQLGLKLEKSRGQVETLVIDHIERPSKN